MAMTGPLHGFLAGLGPDSTGRTVETVLAFPDGPIEDIHDYIQWLFPLPARSRAQPGAPVLTAPEIAAIRIDPRAQANLHRAAARMQAFYRGTRHWLVRSDHNHLRISRIIRSLRILVDDTAAHAFFDEITAMDRAAGFPVDPGNRRYWSEALRSEPA